MVDIHRVLVTRVFLLLCAVYILSKIVVVVFQSIQCIQHHCVLIQVFACRNFTPNRCSFDFVTNAWVEETQYWSAYNGFFFDMLF